MAKYCQANKYEDAVELAQLEPEARLVLLPYPTRIDLCQFKCQFETNDPKVFCALLSFLVLGLKLLKS